MHRAQKQLAMVVLFLVGGTLPLAAQTRLAKPVIGAPPVISGPAYLTANMTSYGAWLRWPSVTDATGYKVTRVNYPGQPETLISAHPLTSYVFEGNNCAVGNAFPNCVYFDNQFRTTATKLSVTYRVYAVIPSGNGPITTRPSPPASVVWSCPDCPKLP